MVSVWWTTKVACGIALAGLVGWTALRHPTRWLGPDPLRLAGQCLVLAGALLSLAHYALLKRHVGDLSQPLRLLCRGGLFGRVRHPMYLGDLLLYLGLAAVARGPLALALLALGTVAVVRQARLEDRQLADRFGEAFRAWQRRTGLLLPRLRPPRTPGAVVGGAGPG